MADTLVQAIREGRSVVERGFTFLDHKLNPTEVSHGEICAEAERRGACLRSLGLERGDRIGLIVPDNRDFVLWFLGSITVGVVPIPLYPPVPGGRLDGYLNRMAKMLWSCQARAVVTSKHLSPHVEVLVAKVPSLEELVLSEAITAYKTQGRCDIENETDIQPSDACFIQFTSGSTGDPKAVLLSHANVMANAHGLLKAIRADVEADMAISWLPLYHDMGLMLVMAPVILHSSAVFMSPMTFITRPQSWLEAVHRYRGTITASPNFGLGLAAKRHQNPEELDLSCLRVIVCGAESVNPGTVGGFVETFRPAGLRPTAVLPAYGMAEATLCVTLAELEAPLRVAVVDREAYENADQVRRVESKEDGEGLQVVSCGRPLPRHTVSIMREDGTLAREGEVAEVVFSGPSVTRGYFRDRKGTSELFRGEWMMTGDLGFLLDGELFISGRKKDLIIVAGRNYHPQAIEWCVEQIPGIRMGNVVAFSIPHESGEQVIVVAEHKEPTPSQQLVDTIRSHVAADIGITVRQVVFVDKGSLPKTSSGKLQRNKARAAYEMGELRIAGGSRYEIPNRPKPPVRPHHTMKHVS